jgi:RNA polymerase sigma-70 factor (ECF subfamily)
LNAPASELSVALSPEGLHGRYSAKIEGLIRRVLGADADREDIRQDVLMTVLRKVHSVRDPQSLDFWVRQVTLNTLKYTMRQRRLRRHPSLETLPETLLPSCQANFESRELARRAVRVLDRLPRNDRSLLLCYWLGSETADEIAERAGCSTITVRRRLFKARSRFERLARRDPVLARCLDEPNWSPRFRSSFDGDRGRWTAGA